MSTDVKPMWMTLHRLRKELEEEKAFREQAERAQTEAELQAGRAEERAHLAEEEGAGWASFARALADYYVIDEYADPRMPDDMRIAITDLLYKDWSTGTPVHDLNVEPLVNGYNEAIQ